jgi:type IV pilus assembly protein PilM
VSKLYLSGGGSKIKDFDIVLQQQIGVPVEVANPFKRVEYSGKNFDMDYLRESAHHGRSCRTGLEKGRDK